MSRNTGNRSAAPRKSSSPLLTGILLGMVIGVGMAAGLAWYIMKSPSPFVHREQVAPRLPADAARQQPATAKPATPSLPPTTVASGVDEAKPRFEFYKVLTDKQEPAVATTVKPVDKPQTAKPQIVDSKTAAGKEPGFLQAGSFSDSGDAEKLKAKLAMMGVETYIQTVTIPDKGVWHRVRMGPYTNSDEMNRTRNLLKQNGVDATPIRP